MDLGLKNKTAFVTGGSSGIGAATAQILAQEGSDVILTYHRNRPGADRTAQIIQSYGHQAWVIQMDIADPGSIDRALEQTKAAAGNLDLLIFCAGQNMISPMREITPQQWDQVMSVNLNGVFFLLQSLLPHLNPGAAIVMVASVAAHTGAPHHMHYAAAKAGLVNLTKSLARELGPDIRVNCVAPGITLTTMGKDTIASLPRDYAEKKLLVRDFATPEEIARCIVFVASPVARFMTGATVDINGGRDLR
jgi:3-oxoacyl-[acyl-carrier protein] reductase